MIYFVLVQVQELLCFKLSWSICVSHIILVWLMIGWANMSDIDGVKDVKLVWFCEWHLWPLWRYWKKVTTPIGGYLKSYHKKCTSKLSNNVTEYSVIAQESVTLINLLKSHSYHNLLLYSWVISFFSDTWDKFTLLGQVHSTRVFV